MTSHVTRKACRPLTMLAHSKSRALRFPSLKLLASGKPLASDTTFALLLALTAPCPARLPHAVSAAAQKQSEVDDTPVEAQVAELAQSMRGLMHARPGPVQQFLLDSCIELAHKLPTYAMLLGAPTLIS